MQAFKKDRPFSTRDLTTETDALALALVREYLVKRGYRAAAAALDAAKPRDSNAVTSRKLLAKGLGVEKIVRKYHDDQPKTVTLDAIVAYLVDKAAASPKMPRSSTPNAASESAGGGFAKGQWIDSEMGRRTERILVAAKLGSTRGEKWSSAGELLVEDVDEELSELENLGLESLGWSSQVQRSNPVERSNSSTAALSSSDGLRIRKLLFGLAVRAPESWMQGFYFSDQRRLEFGLIQRRGGPCGVLAAMQAFIIDDMLQRGLFDCYDARIVTKERDQSLARAITRVLWQASAAKREATVIQFNTRRVEDVALDWLATQVSVYKFRSKADLSAFVRSKLASFQGNVGILIFLYSLVLCHGIDEVQKDRDEAALSPMIGEYDYCSQDLVNLMLTGTAVPNVFDHNRVLETQGSGGSASKSIVLKGVQRRSVIGFLTLHEYYENVEVGRFLKDPERNIWVVCSESHFTCLFSLEPDNLRVDQSLFTLWYYDSLANQNEPIILTVERTDSAMEEECPPLEKVISTRWGPIIVAWEGSEPLL